MNVSCILDFDTGKRYHLLWFVRSKTTKKQPILDSDGKYCFSPLIGDLLSVESCFVKAYLLQYGSCATKKK